MEHTGKAFAGRWITSAELAALKPVNVFHRQFDPIPEANSGVENRHVLFRKKFTVDSPSTLKALIRITADDYYKLFINGHFVTQGPSPGYPFHYYYNTIDVSSFLRPGENVLAVHTYYQGLINMVWVSGDDRHGLLLDMELDGKTILQSDTSFLCREHSGFSAMGKTGYQTQFLEQYDSNADEADFTASGYDDSRWEHAAYREHCDWTIFPQPTPQLVFETITPVSLGKTAGGYVADFSSIYVGYLQLKARGKKGDRITIRCGQELYDDGSVRFDLRASCRYEETWILSGEDDTLDQFDYKSFRYVELLLPPGCSIEEQSLTFSARHYPFTLKAVCNSDDPRHRAVWKLCINSLTYGVQEVIQDCMDREKGQYLGDGCYSSLAHGIATGDFGIFEKLIRDSLRSAFVTRGLMARAACSNLGEIADYPLYAPIFCVMHYQLTGDIAFLREVFPGLRDMIRCYRDSYTTGTGMLGNLDKWSVVEWPPEARDGYDVPNMDEKKQLCRTVHNVINAQYIGAAKFINKIAALIGAAAVIDTTPLVKAYQAAFYDGERGFFKDSVSSTHISLAGNVNPLLYDLCPDRRCEENILGMIKQKRLSASMFFSTYTMLVALVRLGEKDLVKDLIADEGGWLRMIREGAVTTWEGWGKDSKDDISFFHLCFTYPVHFLTDWGMEKIFEGIPK